MKYWYFSWVEDDDGVISWGVSSTHPLIWMATMNEKKMSTYTVISYHEIDKSLFDRIVIK